MTSHHVASEGGCDQSLRGTFEILLFRKPCGPDLTPGVCSMLSVCYALDLQFCSKDRNGVLIMDGGRIILRHQKYGTFVVRLWLGASAVCLTTTLSMNGHLGRVWHGRRKGLGSHYCRELL